MPQRPVRLLSSYLIPVVTAVAGVAALGWWVYGYLNPTPVKERPLGIEEFQVQAARPSSGRVQLPAETSFSRPDVPVPPMPGLWPWFRGPARDNIASTPEQISLDWPASGPPALWSVAMGEGYAAPAVRNGRVFVLDYDQANQADAIRCFSLATGEEIWRRSYPVVVKRNHGMSRTIPAVTDEYVVTLGPKCHLTCVRASDGTLVWQHDLVAEYGVTVPEWYAGQCPIADGELVVVGTGGQALMMAFRLKDGSVAWQTPNPRKWVMTHSSILPIPLDGKKQYVWCGSGGIAGVDAATGKLLWENLDWVINTATVPTPVDLGEGRLFLTGGYNAGSMFLRLSRSPDGYRATVEKRLTAQVFGAEQQTPIFYKGHLYGVKSGGKMVCLDLNGNTRWDSGTDRFGLGPYLIWNGVLLAMSDSGTLSAIEASPGGYRRLAQAKVLPGPEAWGPMAPAGTRLLVRDLTRMVCLELGKR